LIVVVDYSVGNLAAVSNMLQRVGASCKISSAAEDLESASGLVLPGNGSFDACVGGLKASGLLPALERAVLNERKPLLGICVGAQLLGYGSEEGKLAGLGWLPLECKRFVPSQQFRVPHMGWADVTLAGQAHPMLEGFGEGDRFYFSHSYYLSATDPAINALHANHDIRFSAAVARDNLFAVQFHPEKSHKFGLKLFSNFARLCKVGESDKGKSA
jgi:imidazole glycerol-phosphate synthase subunit HisH